MNINILGSPAFWTAVVLISVSVMDSHKRQLRKIADEQRIKCPTADIDYPEGALTIIFLGRMLSLGGAIMVLETIRTASITEALVCIAMTVIFLISSVTYSLVTNKISYKTPVFWLVRSMQIMSVGACAAFWSIINNHPETRTWPACFYCLAIQATISLIFAVFVASLYAIMHTSGYRFEPEGGLLKPHLKWLPIFNPATSAITIPLYLLYVILRGIFRFINCHRKAKTSLDISNAS